MTKKQTFVLKMTIAILVFSYFVILAYRTLDDESKYTVKVSRDSIELGVDNSSKNETNLQPQTEDSSKH